MRTLVIATVLMCVVGCSSASHESLSVVGSTQSTTTTESSVGTKSENEPRVGTVAHVKIGDAGREKNLNDRLHFCVFENGESDYIYVGTKYGMWSNGQFDLAIDGKIVFTGNIEHLVYGGVIIQMGNVLSEPLRSNFGVHITRVSGTFK